MPYTIDQLQQIISPIARAYGVRSVSVFGSYSRGDATVSSDVDLKIEKGALRTLFQLSGFRLAVEDAAKKELPVLLYENEEHFSLRQAVSAAPFASAALMTGPEGGFTREEVHLAQELGMKICTLGPRILRCETAPLCALTATVFAAGELD